MARVRAYLFLLLVAAAAFFAVWWWQTAPTRFALALVEAARSPGGIAAGMVDDQLVERLRRVELARRLSVDTADRDQLIGALRGEAGPDRQYPPAERPTRQRERAARGLRSALAGACTASRWPDGARQWIARVTGPGLTALPDEVTAEQRALRRELSSAEGVLVSCASGEVGLLLVHGRWGGPGGGAWGGRWGGRRVADIFPARPRYLGANPFDPAMK